MSSSEEEPQQQQQPTPDTEDPKTHKRSREPDHEPESGSGSEHEPEDPQPQPPPKKQRRAPRRPKSIIVQFVDENVDEIITAHGPEPFFKKQKICCSENKKEISVFQAIQLCSEKQNVHLAQQLEEWMTNNCDYHQGLWVGPISNACFYSFSCYE